MKIDIKTAHATHGDIVQEVTVKTGDTHQQVLRAVLRTREQQIREGLIALGWTPPEGTRHLAERIVRNAPTFYTKGDCCPCCGYDAIWDCQDHVGQMAMVAKMLTRGLDPVPDEVFYPEIITRKADGTVWFERRALKDYPEWARKR